MSRGHSALVVVGLCAGIVCLIAASHIRHSERRPAEPPTRIAIEVACLLPSSPSFPGLRGCRAFGPSPSDLPRSWRISAY
jgi:hypothetical protein